MILGVVSDTHLPRFGRELPPALLRGLTRAKVDVIAHCGDLTQRIAIELLEEIAPVIAVAGNNDGKELHRELGERKIIEADDARIGVVHGHAGKGRSTPDRARREGILLFNPGSPTDKRVNPAYSYGIVRIEGARIRATHRFYLSRR